MVARLCHIPGVCSETSLFHQMRPRNHAVYFRHTRWILGEPYEDNGQGRETVGVSEGLLVSEDEQMQQKGIHQRKCFRFQR